MQVTDGVRKRCKLFLAEKTLGELNLAKNVKDSVLQAISAETTKSKQASAEKSK